MYTDKIYCFQLNYKTLPNKINGSSALTTARLRWGGSGRPELRGLEIIEGLDAPFLGLRNRITRGLKQNISEITVAAQTEFSLSGRRAKAAGGEGTRGDRRGLEDKGEERGGRRKPGGQIASNDLNGCTAYSHGTNCSKVPIRGSGSRPRQ